MQRIPAILNRKAGVMKLARRLRSRLGSGKRKKDIRYQIARRCILLLSSRQYDQVEVLMSYDLSLLLKQDGLRRIWERRFKLYGDLDHIRKVRARKAGDDVQVDYRCNFSRGTAIFRIRLNSEASISEITWFDCI